MRTVSMPPKATRAIVILLLVVPLHSVVAQNEYEGYKIVKRRPGYDKAQCVIEHANPTVGHEVAAWVGLDNNDITGSKWMWIQAGWYKMSAWPDVQMYWEYTNEEGLWSGVNPVGAAPPGGAGYGVRINGSQVEWIAGDGVVKQLPLTGFDREPFCGAQFCAEMLGSSADYTPGSISNPCDFSAAVIREIGGSEVSAAFSLAQELEPSASNGRVSTGGGGAFITWDIRVP